MSNVLHAFTAFFDHLRAIAWTPVLFALLCQFAKICARYARGGTSSRRRTRTTRVRWRSVFGASVAGAGVNAIVPVRGGDVLRLFLVKRRIEGATYATLASSLFVEAIFDVFLTGLSCSGRCSSTCCPASTCSTGLPSVDWFWLFRHPRVALARPRRRPRRDFVLGLWAARKIEAFRARVAQGVVILRTPGRYLRSVAAWQLVDWVLRIAVIYFFLRAFHVTANLDNALKVQVTQSLSTIVPLTPAGSAPSRL